MSTNRPQEEAPIHRGLSWEDVEGRLASGILTASEKNLLNMHLVGWSGEKTWFSELAGLESIGAAGSDHTNVR